MPHKAGATANEGDTEAEDLTSTATNKGGSEEPAFRNVHWADKEDERTLIQDPTTVSEGDDIDMLSMPEIVNLQESGLRRFPRIAAQKEKKAVLRGWSLQHYSVLERY